MSILLEMIERNPSCQINLLYDVACLLKTYLQVKFKIQDIMFDNQDYMFNNLKKLYLDHLLIFLLQKSKQTKLLERLKLAVPIFHGYGHKASCQVPDFSLQG